MFCDQVANVGYKEMAATYAGVPVNEEFLN